MNKHVYRHSLSRPAELLDLYDMQMDAVVPIEGAWASFTTETHPCNVEETITVSDWRQLATTMTMPPIWLDPKHHELVLAQEQLCPELAAFLRSLGGPERLKTFVYHTRVSNFVSVHQFQGGLQEYLAAAYLENRASPSVSHVLVGIGYSIFEVAVYEHEPSEEPEEVVRARLFEASKKSRKETLDARIRMIYFDSVTNTTRADVSLGDLGRLRQEFNETPLPNATRLALRPEHSQMFELMPFEQFLKKARPQMDLFEMPIWRIDMQEGLDPALNAMRKWRVLGHQILALTNELNGLTPRQIEESEDASDEKRALDDLWSCLRVSSQFGVGLLVNKSQLKSPEPRVKNILVFDPAVEEQQTFEWTFFIDAFTCMIELCANNGFFVCPIKYFETYLVDKASEFTKPGDDVFILEHAEGKYRVKSSEEARKWSHRIRMNTYKTEWNDSLMSKTPSQTDAELGKQSNSQDDAEAVKSFGEGMFGLQIDAEPRSVELRQTLNLILFGEANLINLLVNLVAFESFDAAAKGQLKSLRPSPTAKLLDQNNNEVQVDEETFSCEVRVNGKLLLLSIVDASSLNSSERVVERVGQLVGCTALCFLLKPNQTWLTPESLDPLKEVFANLRNDTSPQICFCYANSNREVNVQNEGSTTADAMSSICEIAKESGMEISRGASNSFYFDEKLFDFLFAKESNHLQESVVDAFRQPWEQSAASLAKLIAHAADQ